MMKLMILQRIRSAFKAASAPSASVIEVPASSTLTVPSEPVRTVLDERREAAINKVRQIVADGVKAETLETIKYLESTGTSKTKARMEARSMYGEKTNETMTIASRLSTETLEYIAEEIGDSRKDYDQLHQSLTHYKDFSKVISGPSETTFLEVKNNHADMAVRDYIFLRDCGVRCTSDGARVLMEMYSNFDISPGGIHQGESEWIVSFYRGIAASLDYSASLNHYRKSTAIGSDPFLTTQQKLRKKAQLWGNCYEPCLTPRIVEYLRDNPGHVEKLNDYIRGRKQRLNEVSFMHFNDYAGTQAALSEGVL